MVGAWRMCSVWAATSAARCQEALLKMAPNSEAGIVGLADVFIQTAAHERGAARSVSDQQAGETVAASQFWHAELCGS